MKLLALDTSTLACSVALQLDDDVLDRHVVKAREHTRLLLPMIREILSIGGLSPHDLDAVVLGNGPGSFIGLRIAAAVAQGVCHAAGVALVPVSSLAAIALRAVTEHAASQVLVAQDAHMNEVYLGIFAAAAGSVVETSATRLQAVGEISGLAPGYAAAGAGWERYPELGAANRHLLTGRLDLPYPRARELLQLGSEALRRGDAIDPVELQPVYLRERVASPAPAGPV